MPEVNYTVAQFDAAAARLLTERNHAYLTTAQGFNRAQVCERIARLHFLGKLPTAAPDDLALIRSVATNLWLGDGDTGLAR